LKHLSKKLLLPLLQLKKKSLKNKGINSNKKGDEINLQSIKKTQKRILRISKKIRLNRKKRQPKKNLKNRKNSVLIMINAHNIVIKTRIVGITGIKTIEIKIAEITAIKITTVTPITILMIIMGIKIEEIDIVSRILNLKVL